MPSILCYALPSVQLFGLTTRPLLKPGPTTPSFWTQTHDPYSFQTRLTPVMKLNDRTLHKMEIELSWSKNEKRKEGRNVGDKIRNDRMGTEEEKEEKCVTRNEDVGLCLIRQRRQSGLKSGGSWPRVKKFRFSRQFSEKFRFFQAILQTKIKFSGQISKNFLFFR